MAFLFPPKNHPEWISKCKEHVVKVKYDKINFPVKLKYIPKIENMNDIRFNAFGVYGKQSIYSLYISNKICDKICNLLLIENNNKKHYVWIKDFNKLMSTQSKDGHKIYIYLLLLFATFHIRKHTDKSYRGLPQN